MTRRCEQDAATLNPLAVTARWTASLPNRFLLCLLCLASGLGHAQGPGESAAKKLLWGDTHLHSTYSSDAFANNNLLADPDTAFRYAKGEPVVHPYHQARVQLRRPLDFLALSDHAEFMGVIRHTYMRGPVTEDLGLMDRLKAQIATAILRYKVGRGEGRELFVPILPAPEDAMQAAKTMAEDGQRVGWLPRMDSVEADTWKLITDTAERHNDPGKFTALVAWEWSSTPGGANLHRIVVTDANAAQAQTIVPFGLDQSPYPEDLWAFLEQSSEALGARFIAIPHNSNISKGAMFAAETLRGEAITAEYARTRMRWEPIAEITQIKGDSETHSILSPDDDFADFETYPYYIQQALQPYEPQVGDYLRSALKRGLLLEKQLGENPYQLGFIGSTDSHTSLSSAEEDNFHGKMATDSIPANKDDGFGNKGGTSGWAMSASGLAAVWATENTRAAIMDAFERREVYATTGPRIALRFFAGEAFTDLDGESLDSALRGAVPMGGLISTRPEGTAPQFYVEALHDPDSAYLDRIQIIKGWVDAQGEAREQVFDVALSDESRRRVDGTVASVGDSVSRKTGRVDNSIGAARLTAVWQDPDFDPALSAFYYARVLQIPTARHSLLDALALGLEHAGDQPDTIQERAYSSPIWVRP